LAEIKKLHSEILTSLDKAIRIGELLVKEKSQLQHGAMFGVCGKEPAIYR